jgi:hypothetical protein
MALLTNLILAKAEDIRMDGEPAYPTPPPENLMDAVSTFHTPSTHLSSQTAMAAQAQPMGHVAATLHDMHPRGYPGQVTRSATTPPHFPYPTSRLVSGPQDAPITVNSQMVARKPRFTMGPRADCEKCRLGVKGHWAHYD